MYLWNYKQHIKKLGQKETKLKLYKTMAIPVLIYDIGNWVLTKEDKNNVQAAKIRFLRAIKHYKRLNKFCNDVG